MINIILSILIIILIIRITYYNSKTPKIGDFYIERNSQYPLIIEIYDYFDFEVVYTIKCKTGPDYDIRTESRKKFLCYYAKLPKNSPLTQNYESESKR